MKSDELIDAKELALLLNKGETYAKNKIHNDSTFPRPCVERLGNVGGKPKKLWRKSEIMIWHEADQLRPKTKDGRNLTKRTRNGDEYRAIMDNNLMRRFITGHFQTDRQHMARIRRITRARRNQAGILKHERTKGDW